MKKTKFILSIFILSLIFQACKTDITGELIPNQAPETHTIADTIIQTGGQRFNTKVNIKWWGDDPDGFIVGYEYSFDTIINEHTDWQFTQSSDTIFSFTIPSGSDTLDFAFNIRAIDNEGKIDPTPARLWYPIKNTKPTIDFVYVAANQPALKGGNQAITFPVLRFNWEIFDADGMDNLKGIELYLNDTSQQALEIESFFTGVTLVADDLTASISDCSVFLGALNTALNEKLPGLLLNDTNIFYIRAVDLSDAKSPFKASNKVFVRKLSSKTLLVNAFNSGISNLDNFYENELQSIGITDFDKLQLLTKQNENFTQLAPDFKTQAKIFALFDNIIWYADDLDFTIVFAQNTLTDFINQGGNILLSSRLSGQSAIRSNFYDFTPIDSLFQPPASHSFLFTDTSSVYPIEMGFPVLKHTEFLSVVRPIKFVDGTKPLMRANVLLRKPNFQIELFQGISTIAGIRTNPVTSGKFALIGLQLHKLNGDNNVSIFLEKVLKDEFGL